MSELPGAYGTRFRGIDDKPEVAGALVRAPEHWPSLSVEHVVEDPAPVTPELTADRARILLAEEGHALLDRARRTVVLRGPRSLWSDWFVHPTLAAVNAVFANWLGRNAIHAGAFVGDDGAWALIGVSQAGKSSTLGWLAAAGYPVLADDLVVVDGGMTFAGPRTLDLVPSSAQYLGHDGRLVRDGERHRVKLQAVEPEMPLRGWIALGWGEALESRPIRPKERLAVLLDHLRLPFHSPGSGALLDLAALPGFEVRRPRRLEGLGDAAETIAEVATSG
jgi:hypothetical protein